MNASLERRQTLQRLRRAILSLPRRYREVIVLCDLQDVSYNDAAAAVGCAVGTIRSRLHRARSLLTQKMGCAMSSEEDHQPLSMRCAV
jgi:RNA polymerase sigma-70 factor (ECF subfamily)